MASGALSCGQWPIASSVTTELSQRTRIRPRASRPDSTARIGGTLLTSASLSLSPLALKSILGFWFVYALTVAARATVVLQAAS